MTNTNDDASPGGQALLTEGDEVSVVGQPAFVAYFYSHEGIDRHAVSILDSWLNLVGSSRPLWFSDEKSKRFSKLTPKNLEKLHRDYSTKSLEGKFASYIIKSASESKPVHECDAFSFEMFATEGNSGYVYVAFPVDHIETVGTMQVIGWFNDWCTRFSFTHAGAGFGYEIAWFYEQSQVVGPVMLTQGLKFHGIRVWDRYSARFRERTPLSLDTAAWLTYLDNKCIERVGANAVTGLDGRVMRHPSTTGITLQAGPAPDQCDADLQSSAYQDLKAVNDIIRPIRTTAWEQNGWASIGDLNEWTGIDETTENSWFARMDD